MANAIEAELIGVSKLYGSTPAIQDINLVIEKGQTIAVIGHNGSGKTTLLKIVTGVLQPTTGKLAIRGQTTSFASISEARKLGFEILTQDSSLFPHLTALENLFVGSEPVFPALGLQILDKKKMYRSASELINSAGLRLPLDVPVSHLSHGQQALVAFMRLLNGNPSFVAFDEPTASLGYQEREAVNQQIRSLARRGVTVLLVTHILEDALDLADRIVILGGGRIILNDLKKNLSNLKIVECLTR